MRNKYMMLFAASLMAVSCNDKLPEEQKPEPFHSFEAAAPTITAASGQQLQFVWNESDEVSVFDGTESTEYLTRTDTEPIQIVNDAIDIDPDKTFYACFPANATGDFDGGTVTCTVPSSQAFADKIADAVYAVATTSGEARKFEFRCVNSLLSIRINDENVESLSIQTSGSESIAGTVTARCEDGGIASIGKDGTGEITLNAENTVQAGTYYIAVLPQDFTDGLTVTTIYKDGSRVQIKSKPLKAEASRCSEIEFEQSEQPPMKEYLITNAAQLQAFLKAAPDCEAGTVAMLKEDINLEGVVLEGAASFAGTFDGEKHSLDNWKATEPLFTTLSGTVANLVIGSGSSYTINDAGNESFIVGNNAGSVINCINNGRMTSENRNFSESRAIATIVADNRGSVADCTNNGSITIDVPGHYKVAQWIGGVVGKTSSSDAGTASVKGCANNGGISYTTGRNKSTNFIGGVVGGTPANVATEMFSIAGLDDYGIIEDCVNNADISVIFKENCENMTNLNLGGVAGYVEGTVRNCRNQAGKTITFDSPTEGTNNLSHSAIGGIVGFVEMSLADCANAADMVIKGIFSGGGASMTAGSGIYTPTFIGGVAGSAGPNTGGNDIVNCSNSGKMDLTLLQTEVSSGSHYIGGVVAYSKAPMQQCANTGSITIRSTAMHKYIGGIAGQDSYQMEKCSNKGDITLDNILSARNGDADKRNVGSIFLGGVTGYHAVATIDSNIGTSKLKTLDSNNAGNITVSNGCYATTLNYIGGIVGMSFGEIRGSSTGSGVINNTSEIGDYTCFNSGDILVTAPGKFYLGGLAGSTSAKIINALNEGDITITGIGCQAGSMIGGIAGTTWNTLQASLDGQANAKYGAQAGKAGYVCSVKADMSIKSQGVSGIGFAFGKLNATGSVKFGPATAAPQWHSSVISGTLTIEGDLTKAGVISGGGLGNSLSLGLSQPTQAVLFKNIVFNGTPLDKEAIIGKMGQNIVLWDGSSKTEGNVRFLNVSYEQ